MSDYDTFLSIYVTPNRHPDAPEYDAGFMQALLDELSRSGSQSPHKLSLSIVFAISCALRRADLVLFLFRTLAAEQDWSTERISQQFSAVRETINIIWPFVGVPQVVPACMGLAGYFKHFGRSERVESVQNGTRFRPDIGPEDARLGTETREEIYKASGNSEVFEMLENHFGDFAYALNAVGFGYNIGRANGLSFTLMEAELIVTAALIGLGATRQVGSHIKACIGFGFSEVEVEQVVAVANKMAEWNRTPLPSEQRPVDVRKLAEQAREHLKTKVS